MAFAITLQRNNSENNRLTKDVTDIITVTGELKTETSIVDPVILIECEITTLKACNYMTIPVFDRSYFVNNIRSIRTGLVEFTCHVDVLSSFADAVKEQTAIIARQENEWNLMLNDAIFKLYQNPKVLTQPFPTGFTTQEFVLAVAGGTAQSGV